MCRQNCVCRLHIETCVQENVVKLTQTRIWSFSMILRLGMSTHLWEMTFSGLSCLWDVTGLATKTAIDRFERFNEFTALVQRSLTDPRIKVPYTRTGYEMILEDSGGHPMKALESRMPLWETRVNSYVYYRTEFYFALGCELEVSEVRL